MLKTLQAFCVFALSLTPVTAAEFADVSPRPMRSVFQPADPHPYADAEIDRREKVCPELTPAYFAGVEKGRLLPPAKYDLSGLDAHDKALLDSALPTALRYADINNAVADGYRLQSNFGSGMGIHMMNLAYVLDDAVDAAKPEFLTYARSRDTNAYQLLQVGYIQRRKRDQGPYHLFHAEAAHGHFHDQDWCVQISSGVFLDTEAPCIPGTTHVGPIWMMHLAVNLYNEEGLFADFFSCANHISRTGRQYTFFGKPLKKK